MSTRTKNRPAQTLHVFRAEQFRVANGANLGDGLGFADELHLDDVYRLAPTAGMMPIDVLAGSRPVFQIAEGSETGTPGAELHLDCCITLMSADGKTTEGLVLVETDAEGNIAQIYFQPLAPMVSQTEYVLVGVNQDNALQRFAQMACVSFTAGTQITMANGAQRAVEDLQVGDRILTRDDGPQEIRWMGHQTSRAVGAFAPICIKAGTLNNARDLYVSPDHRLFIYQREDRLGAGRSELLVRARHLVNGESVTYVNGGFVDYYQMMFDSHQIVYAEGIAAESMLIDTNTSAAFSADIGEKLQELIPGHHKTDHRSLEVQEGLLARPDAADLLKKSSMS